MADDRREDAKREEISDEMQTTAPPEDPVVQFGGRIPTSLRRRARMCAAAQDLDAQSLLRAALEEYLDKRGF
jgi:hypothetical protein